MKSGNTENESVSAVSPAAHDPYGALRLRDYRLYLTGSVIATLGMQMQAVAVGWEVYERTSSAMKLGWIGLAQVLPVILLVVPAGHVADRFDRRRVVMTAELVIAACSLGLAWVSIRQAHVDWVYVLLLLNGTARAFLQPARASLLPLLVPRERFSNAVTWNSGGFHLASILGPAVGGSLIAVFQSAAVVYIGQAAASLAFFALLAMIALRTFTPSTEAVTLRSLGAGFGFLWHAPVILSAITLDMFAVLLGGATTLLPIYARDILRVDAAGLGWMRAAPAIGALFMAILLAYRPPLERAGLSLIHI